MARKQRILYPGKTEAYQKQHREKKKAEKLKNKEKENK